MDDESKIERSVSLSPEDLNRLKQIRRAINKTAYHGGLGLRESGRFLSTMDKLLEALGVSLDDWGVEDPDPGDSVSLRMRLDSPG